VRDDPRMKAVLLLDLHGVENAPVGVNSHKGGMLLLEIYQIVSCVGRFVAHVSTDASGMSVNEYKCHNTAARAGVSEVTPVACGLQMGFSGLIGLAN